MPTLVEEFSSCCDYFVGLPGFPDLIEKVFLVNWCREKFTVFTEKGMGGGGGGGGGRAGSALIWDRRSLDGGAHIKIFSTCLFNQSRRTVIITEE